MRGTTTRTLFGAVKSVWDAGRDMLLPTTVEVDEAHTTSSPLHMDSVTENPVSQKPITFHGEYTRTHTALNHLRTWSTTSTKASGMFNPKIAAVVALGIGLATQGWGSALSGSLGLTGASAAALSAGVSAVCTHVGVQTLQNNGDIKTSVRDMSRTRALMSVLEAMATAGVTSGVSGGLSGVSAHAARAGVKEAVHMGFAAAQGNSVRGEDILKRGFVNAVSGMAAEHIGKAYTDASVDPVLHKILHGAVGGIAGGILGGKDGALSGASAAVVAETLADIMRPTMEEAFAKIAADHPHEQDFHNHVGAYIRHQKDLILLMSVAITASLGGDVNQATFAADNALSNNWVQAALVAATAGYTVYEAYDIYKTYEAQGAEAAAKQLGLVVVETAAGAAVGTVVFKVAGVVYPTAAAALTAYKAANPGFAKAYEGVVKIAHSGVASVKASVGSLAQKAATKAEIRQIYTPKYWTKKGTHTFHGQTNKVYKRDDLIDLGKVGKDGRSNFQRMSSGDAPLGLDSRPINLHHTIQTQDGALAEITSSMHNKNHKMLHMWTNGSAGGVTRAEVRPSINRQAFDKWKREYWKARAKELGGK